MLAVRGARGISTNQVRTADTEAVAAGIPRHLNIAPTATLIATATDNNELVDDAYMGAEAELPRDRALNARRPPFSTRLRRIGSA